MMDPAATKLSHSETSKTAYGVTVKISINAVHNAVRLSYSCRHRNATYRIHAIKTARVAETEQPVKIKYPIAVKEITTARTVFEARNSFSSRSKKATRIDTCNPLSANKCEIPQARK